MKALLLAPYPQISYVSTTQYPPLGLLYIGGSIVELVDGLQILDANALQLNISETVERILLFSPDVVGISINVVTAKVARTIANEVRKLLPNVKLIAGGPLPTVCPDDWLQCFDVVVVGEGEIPFREIINKIKDGQTISENIKGICTRNGHCRHAEHPNLDELPLPAYDYLVPKLAFYSKKARVVKKIMAPILTSRGCPYSCVFCDKSVHGTNFRPRTVESVLKEIAWLRNKYGVRQIDILDDNFTFDVKRASDILDGIIKIGGFAVNCQNGIRADRVNKELIDKMKRAGVFRVGIGIESGNYEVLKKLNKNLDLNIVISTIRLFRKKRITVQGYFILGFPYEDSEAIKDTIKFAIKANPHFANFSHFFPIIGTPIYNELKNSGKLYNENGEAENGFYRDDPYYDNQLISNEKMQKIYRWSWRKFYFRPYKILDIILCIKSWKELLWVVRIAISMAKNKLLSK